MPLPEFPPYAPSEYELRNVNDLLAEARAPGGKAADWVAKQVGSWRFIILQSILITVWIILNVAGFILAWDPYPFILMNLVLSSQAAFTAPIIMMSQNRQAAKDRIESHNDYEINKRAVSEIEQIIRQIQAQNEALSQIHDMLADLQAQVNAQNQSN
jgi:uncharacterized membrane protein